MMNYSVGHIMSEEASHVVVSGDLSKTWGTKVRFALRILASLFKDLRLHLVVQPKEYCEFTLHIKLSRILH